MTGKVAKKQNSKSKGKASDKEVIPSYKEFKSKEQKTVTFSKFVIHATKGVTEKRLKSHLKKIESEGYFFSYKGLHLAGDNTVGEKVEKVCYIFTAIQLRVPSNFDKEKIVDDLQKKLGTRVIKFHIEGIYEDYSNGK